MNREEAHKHKKRKSGKTLLFTGLFVAVCVSVLIAFLFALGGADFAGIFGNGNYWLTVGVVNGTAAHSLSFNVSHRRAERSAE